VGFFVWLTSIETRSMYFLDQLRSVSSRIRPNRAQRHPMQTGLAGSDLERLEYFESFCSWPQTYYFKTIAVSQLIRPSTIVEVGVAYGYHAAALLTANSGATYIGVDPYFPGYDEMDAFAADVCILMDSLSPYDAFDRLHGAVSEKLYSKFGERASLMREPSREAAKKFADKSVDLIFIDGDHRFDEVRGDLIAWWPKVTRGGALCGDDWDWPDVSKAVKEFANCMGEEVLLIGSPKNLTSLGLFLNPRLSREIDLLLVF